MPFKFRIKNYKLALLALVFFIFLVSLGCWQLSRAIEKKALLTSYDKHMQEAALSTANLNTTQDLRFYRAQVQGHYDHAHTFLLDNKTLHGQVGYEVYTPFIINNLATPILIDRGFIPLGSKREILPIIHTPDQTITITGLLNLPPKYIALGSMQDGQKAWPLRIEYINLNEISYLLKKELYPYVLNLAPYEIGAYEIEWQIVIMPPERHQAYALQWFALALTLLVLFFALNRDSSRKN